MVHLSCFLLTDFDFSWVSLWFAVKKIIYMNEYQKHPNAFLILINLLAGLSLSTMMSTEKLPFFGLVVVLFALFHEACIVKEWFFLAASFLFFVLNYPLISFSFWLELMANSSSSSMMWFLSNSLLMRIPHDRYRKLH